MAKKLKILELTIRLKSYNHYIRTGIIAILFLLGGCLAEEVDQPSEPKPFTSTDEDSNTDTPLTPLVANDDSTTTPINQNKTVTILANDSGTDNTTSITIFSDPSDGAVSFDQPNTITYTPDSDFVGTDSFVYQITNAANDIATATVDIDVLCAECATKRTVTVNWNKNPDTVLGYRIYYGDTTQNINNLAKDVTLNLTGFDPQNPSIGLNGWVDLGLLLGTNLCFNVTAYNIFGESTPSAIVCTTV